MEEIINMAKIKQTFSYTFQPKQGQWSKMELEIDEIDSEIPIADQLKALDGHVELTWKYVKNKIDGQVGDIMETVRKGIEEVSTEDNNNKTTEEKKTKKNGNTDR